MSFNANTMYKAVDIQEIAEQCKDAISGKQYCFAVVGMFGEIEGIYKDQQTARDIAGSMNLLDPDHYWAVEKHPYY
jgi:CheY-specific phosphatase CheX